MNSKMKMLKITSDNFGYFLKNVLDFKFVIYLNAGFKNIIFIRYLNDQSYAGFRK